MTAQLTETERAFNDGLLAAITMLEQELGALPAGSHEATLASLRLGHYRHRLHQLLKRTEAELQAEAEAATHRAT